MFHLLSSCIFVIKLKSIASNISFFQPIYHLDSQIFVQPQLLSCSYYFQSFLKIFKRCCCYIDFLLRKLPSFRCSFENSRNSIFQNIRVTIYHWNKNFVMNFLRIALFILMLYKPMSVKSPKSPLIQHRLVIVIWWFLITAHYERCILLIQFIFPVLLLLLLHKLERKVQAYSYGHIGFYVAKRLCYEKITLNQWQSGVD